jgi:uncharacterized caspase-like protein
VSQWNAQTGELKGAFFEKGKPPIDFRRSNDGRVIAVVSGYFSRSKDGQTVTNVSGADGGTCSAWECATRRPIFTGIGPGVRPFDIGFSPDSKLLALTGHFGIKVMDLATRTERWRFKVNTKKDLPYLPRFVDGGKVLAVSFHAPGEEYRTHLFDAATGKPMADPAVQTSAFDLFLSRFTSDGRFHIAWGLAMNGFTIRDALTGREVCRMAFFKDGGWAVVDPAGRYDASNGGDVDGLHWTVGIEPIALKQLKERYYDPGLLAKLLGWSKEPLRDVEAFRDVKLYPAVAINQVESKKPQLNVTLTNRGGGIGRVVVLVNGKELTSDARPRGAAVDANKLDLQMDLSNDPRLIPGQKNKVEVLAFNAEGYLSSRGMVREFDGPGEADSEPPALHAVIAGISEYRGSKLNLRYAAKDAEDFAAALRLAAGRLFPEKVTLTLLTMANAKDDQRPTRAGLVKALQALRHTKPGDVIVIYLAGHGVTHGGQDGDWHYLTADAQSADLSDPEVRRQVSLSSVELTELLKAVPARKQVLILDTCHSGRVVERLTEKRDVPGSQVRALERVKDRTGMHVLAGCAADAVSYEASRYGQGILTYSLLLAMRGARLREGEYVDVGELFGFAADKVPELARDIGGVQRPTVASPKGLPFDIGRLTAEDRAKVPLQSVKPVVLRSSFQEEKRARDGLGLTKRVNEHLRDASAQVRGAKLVFVDAEDFPGALQAAGRYKVDGDKVIVSVSLYEGEKELAAFTVEGEASKPDEVATRLVTEVEKRLAGKPSP